jgi:hypothetical protein
MASLVRTGDLRAEIEAAVAAGRSFEEIDAGILASHELDELDLEQRDALWLYAWGCLQRAEDGLFVVHPAAVAAEHD